MEENKIIIWAILLAPIFWLIIKPTYEDFKWGMIWLILSIFVGGCMIFMYYTIITNNSEILPSKRGEHN